MKGGGTVQITMAWAAAVMIPAFIFGAASGASFNPALTIALAADGSFAWNMVPGYVIAQIAGGFVGAWIVWLTFKKQFDAEEDAATTLEYSPQVLLSQAQDGTLYQRQLQHSY